MRVFAKVQVILEVTTEHYPGTVQYMSDLYRRAREDAATMLQQDLPSNMKILGETKIIAVMAEEELK